MSIATFKWEDGKLMLLMNRENWESDSRMIKPAAWNANGQILGAWTEGEDDSVGKWCGSKSGRVSFIVESNSEQYSVDANKIENLPVDYLKSTLSPKEFAEHEVRRRNNNDNLGHDLVFHAIVADITSKSMFYIGKESTQISRLKTMEVGNGVHTVSVYQGLDANTPRDSKLKELFNNMIDEIGNEPIPPIEKIHAKFMYAPYVFSQRYNKRQAGSCVDERFGTTNTITLVVDGNGEGIFYEMYLENGRWKDHNFSFLMQ